MTFFMYFEKGGLMVFLRKKYEPGQMGNPLGSVPDNPKGGHDVQKTGAGKVRTVEENPGREVPAREPREGEAG